MYQWRKFEFFEEKSSKTAIIPSEIEGKIKCCSSGRGRIVLGCDDGTVGFVDRSFKLVYSFQAHFSSVLFLQQLKVLYLGLGLGFTQLLALSWFNSVTINEPIVNDQNCFWSRFHLQAQLNPQNSNKKNPQYWCKFLGAIL